ncbi:MAG TPA: hypothetical protein VL485_10665 [Ktedonobacteraceae bacterium]|nr:hypothetical protein [Ktedonobacteraceae bacterium]
MQQSSGNKGDNHISGRSHIYEQEIPGHNKDLDGFRGQVVGEISPPLFGKYDIHFRDKDGSYATLYRVTQLILPGALYLTWQAFVGFQVDHLPPYVTLKHVAEYTKKSLRTIELNMQRLRQSGYLSTAHSLRNGNWVVEKCFDGLYEAVIEYLTWEQSPSYIPPVREYFAIDQLDWATCQPLLRFNNYRRLIRNKKPGPKRKKVYEEEKECVDGVFREVQIEEPAQSPRQEQQEETIHVAIPFSLSPPELPACKQKQEGEPAQNQYVVKEDVQYQAQAQWSEDVQYQERRQQAMKVQYRERGQQSQNAQYRAHERQSGDDQRHAGEPRPAEPRREPRPADTRREPQREPRPADTRREPQREPRPVDVQREPQREPQYKRVDHSSRVQEEPQSIQWDKIPGLFMSPQLANSSPKKQAEPVSDKEEEPQSIQWDKIPGLFMSPQLANSSPKKQAEPVSDKEAHQEVRPALRFDEEIDEDEEYEEKDCLEVRSALPSDEDKQALIVSSTATRQPSARYLARRKRMNYLWSSPTLKLFNETMEEVDKTRWDLALKIEEIDKAREKLVHEMEHWDLVWVEIVGIERDRYWTKEEEFYEQNGYRRYKYPKPMDQYVPPEPDQAEEPVEELQGEVLSTEEYKEPQQLNQQASQEEFSQEEVRREVEDESEVTYCEGKDDESEVTYCEGKEEEPELAKGVYCEEVVEVEYYEEEEDESEVIEEVYCEEEEEEPEVSEAEDDELEGGEEVYYEEDEESEGAEGVYCEAVVEEEDECENIVSPQQYQPSPASYPPQPPVTVVSSELQPPQHESLPEPLYEQKDQQGFQEPPDQMPEGHKLQNHERMRNIMQRTAHLVVSSRPLGSHIRFEEIKVDPGLVLEQPVSEQPPPSQMAIVVEGEVGAEAIDENVQPHSKGEVKEKKVQERMRKNPDKEARGEERQSEEDVSRESGSKTTDVKGAQGVYTVSENGELKGFLFDVVSPEAWIQAWKEHPEMIAQVQNAITVAQAAKTGADDAEREERGEPLHWSEAGAAVIREGFKHAGHMETSTLESVPAAKEKKLDPRTLATMYIQEHMRKKQQEKEQAHEEQKELNRKQRHAREDEQAKQAEAQNNSPGKPASSDLKPLPPGVRDLGNGLIAVPISEEKEVVIIRDDVSTEDFFRLFTGGTPRRKSTQTVRDPRFVEDEDRPRNTGPVSAAFKKYYLENQAKQVEDVKKNEIVLYDASRDPNSAFHPDNQERNNRGWRPGDGFVSRGYLELKKKMMAERESQREEATDDEDDSDQASGE